MRWPSERDAWFAGDLRALYFQARPDFLYGIGSWFGPEVEKTQPLLIVDEREVTIEPFATPAVYRELAATVDWSPLGEWPGLSVGHVVRASERARDALGGWFNSAVVLPADRPVAITRVGSVLLDAPTGERGTVGVPVTRITPEGRSIDGFLTAGHVVSPPSAGILQSSRWVPWRGPRFGQVALRSDPWVGPPASSTPGIDIAVVEFDKAGQHLAPVSSGVAQLPSSPPQPLPVWVHRGFGATRPAMIVAGLMTGGDRQRQWLDCWVMVPGLGTSGDSGAAVVTMDRQLVGMLVGGATQGGSARFAVHYVQDHDSASNAFLNSRRVQVQ